MQVDLSKYNNSWYKPGNPFKRFLWNAVSSIIFKNGLFPVYGLKRAMLRLFGAKLGKGVVLKQNVNIKYPWFLELGDYTWLGENVWIDNLGSIKIGANVCLSQGALLLTGNHDYTKETFDLMIKPIVLEDGVWIGAKAIVCPGITVGTNAVLGLASVATKNLEANGIYQGNPAVKCGERKIIS
jgi:putative colanic acid biosynthesis acetyltransferase WcaF